ncbi:uncharacterized protein AMSG_04985 [Thecamonas trahens ATCC 50062]|uniref:DH domain-containing protein n=1 Tax=Thecamonas trahens ATCC 50062 TaxID=461836 RepID=A0A0L0D8H2_THETB|nr:hypothetical protein AMSG_04985 [Thecamonas trahens ATCC 50062]KNC48540.1 hypothetical protein AMSG_04985 [Thecamonas trahens ATCC 50062]|eukprot:XP_013758647.1 hypothetical protein AMSG_04985 [Thecamonas trahens ATCC 50062]
MADPNDTGPLPHRADIAQRLLAVTTELVNDLYVLSNSLYKPLAAATLAATRPPPRSPSRAGSRSVTPRTLTPQASMLSRSRDSLMTTGELSMAAQKLEAVSQSRTLAHSRSLARSRSRDGSSVGSSGRLSRSSSVLKSKASAPGLDVPFALSQSELDTVFPRALAEIEARAGALQSALASALKSWDASSRIGTALGAFVGRGESSDVPLLAELVSDFTANYSTSVQLLGSLLANPKFVALLDKLEYDAAQAALQPDADVLEIKSVAYYFSRPLVHLGRMFREVSHLLQGTIPSHPDYTALESAWTALQRVETELCARRPQLERVTQLFEYAQLMESDMPDGPQPYHLLASPTRAFVAEAPVYFATVSAPLRMGLLLLFTDVALLLRPPPPPLPGAPPHPHYTLKYWVPLADVQLDVADVMSETVHSNDAYVDYELAASWSAYLAQGWSEPLVLQFDTALEPVILGFPLDEESASPWWDALQSVEVDKASAVAQLSCAPTEALAHELGGARSALRLRSVVLSAEQQRLADLALRAEVVPHHEVQPLLAQLANSDASYMAQLKTLTALVDVTVSDLACVLVREHSGISLVLQVMDEHDMHPDLLAACLALFVNLTLNPLAVTSLVALDVPAKVVALARSHLHAADMLVMALRLLRHIGAASQDYLVALASPPLDAARLSRDLLLSASGHALLATEAMCFLRAFVALDRTANRLCASTGPTQGSAPPSSPSAGRSPAGRGLPVLVDTGAGDTPANLLESVVRLSEWAPDKTHFLDKVMLVLDDLRGFVDVLVQGFALLKALVFGRPEWKDALVAGRGVRGVLAILALHGPAEAELARAGARLAQLDLARHNGMVLLLQLARRHRRSDSAVVALVGAIINAMALEHNLAVLLDQGGVAILTDAMNSSADVAKAYGPALTQILRTIGDRPSARSRRSLRPNKRRPSFDGSFKTRSSMAS